MLVYLHVAIMVLMALATTLLSLTQYRREDKLQAKKKQLKLIGHGPVYAKLALIILVIVLFLPSIAEINQLDISSAIIIGCFISAFPLFEGFKYRKEYYTDDQEYLTYINNGDVKWSHKWIDIVHVYRHEDGLLDGMLVRYDISLKDGTVCKDLPFILEATLKRHVSINYHPYQSRHR